MEQIEKLFPIGDSIAPIDKNNVVSLVIAIVLYVIAAAVAGLFIGLLTKIPVVGFLFAIIGALVGLYALGGIIISVYRFLR